MSIQIDPREQYGFNNAPSDTEVYNSGGTNGDPWAKIAALYGLGPAPAQGLPMTLPGVQYGNAPQLPTDNRDFLDLMKLIAPDIAGSYGPAAHYDPTVIDPSSVPNPTASSYGGSKELDQLLSGIGYSPEVMASLRAAATEGPAQAGVQQLGQMRRALQENGISGGASVGMQSDLARQVGQQQTQGLRDVELQNANVGNENRQFGVGQQTTIGLSNMQSANQMAIASANMMMQALTANNAAANNAGANNANMQNNTNISRGNAMSNYYADQAHQGQQQRNDNQLENARNNLGQMNKQTENDWDRQVKHFNENNSRWGTATQQLGQWSAGG